MPVLQLVVEASARSGQVQEAVDLADVLAELHLSRGEFEEARRICRIAIERAQEARHFRAVPHLQMTLGHSERHSGDPAAAVKQFAAALEYFVDREDDQATVSYIVGDLALCAEDLGELSDAVKLRLLSVSAIEEARARQSRPRFQEEYRRRFAQVYRGALRTVVLAGDSAGFVAVFEGLWGRRLAGLSRQELNAGTDPALIAQLLARAERARWRRGEDNDEQTGVERFRRVLGGAALNAALPEMFDDSIGPELAAVYSPFEPEEVAGLLDRWPDDAALLMLAPIPGVEVRSAGWRCLPPVIQSLVRRSCPRLLQRCSKRGQRPGRGGPSSVCGPSAEFD
ncbi:hypothetical protein [Kribbella voronezhensis]|uniref:hypothetical protein n=1 Tax=Kribbella voronezhensis TaxID=2512212 RepID=UPI001416FAF8|nr:hypothetical protein [Kribbella voronezhensis]